MQGHRTSEVYRQSPGIEFQSVEDGYVLYDGDTRQIIYLNLTAAAIFELCAMALTADAIVEALRINGHASITLESVKTCLDQMIEHQLLLVEEA